jgi:hypothetical protein
LRAERRHIKTVWRRSVVGGGEVGYFFPIIGPNNVSTNLVTKIIEAR